MNKSKEMELSETTKFLMNLGIPVAGLVNPTLGVILGVCNSLGTYRSNEKISRMIFVMEKVMDLIKDEKTEEEFINEIAKGKVEPIFMDFLEKTLRKVSLTNSEDKKRRFAYLLNNAYRFQENPILFDNLDMFSDILEKTSDYQLQILIAHYDKDIVLKRELKSKNESIYKANLNYLMSMELLIKDFSPIIAGLPPEENLCSELSKLFIKFIKEYEN